jgi:YVTN family beta-propeller protein
VDPSSGSIITSLPFITSVIGGLAYDPLSHAVYVAIDNFPATASIVSVIDDTSNTVVASINAGLSPLGLAYDPVYDEIWVTHFSIEANSYSNFVTAISGTSHMVVANVTVGALGARPTGILYDDSNGDIYVADAGSNQVSVISPATKMVIATIPVRLLAPEGLIYDQANNEILVSNQFPPGYGIYPTNVVSVIDAGSNTLLGNFTLGYNPTDGVYATNGYLYVTNYFSGTISIIASPTTGQDFSVNINPPVLQVPVGSTASASISVIGLSGFSGRVPRPQPAWVCAANNSGTFIRLPLALSRN